MGLRIRILKPDRFAPVGFCRRAGACSRRYVANITKVFLLFYGLIVISALVFSTARDIQ